MQDDSKIIKQDGELTGRLTISRPSCSSGEEYINVTVIDEMSGVEFLDLRVSLDGFTRALTSEAHVGCVYELRGASLVGMRAENKTEHVPLVDGGHGDKWKAAMVAQMEVFEVDGWRGRKDDLFNGHRYVRDKDGRQYQRVTFFRHVNPTTGEPINPQKGQST